MDETVIDGKMQDKVPLAQEDIDVLLGIVDVIDDLDDDEVFAIDGIVRALLAESVYNIRWLEDKLDRQRGSPRHE